MNARRRVRSISRGISHGIDGIARPQGLTFLLYHQVGDTTGRSVDVPVDDFRAQMAHLVEHHRVLRLDDAIDELGDPTVPVRPGVVVTFDDGTADLVDIALPILVEYGIPATVYLATGFVEDGVAFPWGAPPASWAGIRDAMSTGLLSVECHTHTHPLMHAMNAAEATAEVDTSIATLQNRLGVTPRHFAYPRAVLGSGDAEQVVKSRFVSAAMASSRPNRQGSTDVHRLTRTPVQRDDAGRFDRLCSGGGWFDGMVRAGATAITHRRAS